MVRSLLTLSVLATCLLTAPARAHEEHGHHGDPGKHFDGHPPHGTRYYALVDDFHTEPSTTDSTGEIFLTLSADRSQLYYTLVLDGQLNLKPVAEDRTEADDIIGIHLHLHVPDTIGPHLLNVFGLPAEEDADLTIDFENHILRGIYDDGDASRDPDTGELYPQGFPLTSKPLSNWLGTLDTGLMMIAVHTNASGFNTMAIHGHIGRMVPEPSSSSLLLACAFWILATGRFCWRLPQC